MRYYKAKQSFLRCGLYWSSFFTETIFLNLIFLSPPYLVSKVTRWLPWIIKPMGQKELTESIGERSIHRQWSNDSCTYTDFKRPEGTHPSSCLFSVGMSSSVSHKSCFKHFQKRYSICKDLKRWTILYLAFMGVLKLRCLQVSQKCSLHRITYLMRFVAFIHFYSDCWDLHREGMRKERNFVVMKPSMSLFITELMLPKHGMKASEFF